MEDAELVLLVVLTAALGVLAIAQAIKTVF
jgi:hypothetical protein